LPCPVALPASLAHQQCPPALQKSLQAVLRAAVGRHACSIAYFYSAGSLVQAFPAIKDTRRMLRYAARFHKKIQKKIQRKNFKKFEIFS
jgi:hypothetical protein